VDEPELKQSPRLDQGRKRERERERTEEAWSANVRIDRFGTENLIHLRKSLGISFRDDDAHVWTETDVKSRREGFKKSR
jgi:hypothetical protein